MITQEQFTEAWKILYVAKISLNCDDYIKIFGQRLGEHIWKQDSSDLLGMWRCGLTIEEKNKFITYIFEKYKDKIE